MADQPTTSSAPETGPDGRHSVPQPADGPQRHQTAPNAADGRTEPADGITLGQLRSELERLVSLANTAERPKPTSINPPDHPMPGHEWRVEQGVISSATKVPTWLVRTVDDSETCDAVYVSTPEDDKPGDNFIAMWPVDARQLAMALIAAADRANHLTARVPRLEDRRNR